MKKKNLIPILFLFALISSQNLSAKKTKSKDFINFEKLKIDIPPKTLFKTAKISALSIRVAGSDKLSQIIYDRFLKEFYRRGSVQLIQPGRPIKTHVNVSFSIQSGDRDISKEKTEYSQTYDTSGYYKADTILYITAKENSFSISKINPGLSMSIKLINAKTGTILWFTEISGRLNRISSTISRIISEQADAMNTENKEIVKTIEKIVVKEKTIQIERKKGSIIIGVMNFNMQGRNKDFQYLKTAIPDSINTTIAKSTLLTVLSRQNIKAVLEELDINEKKEISKDELIQIGKKLKLDAVVQGSIIPMQKEILVNTQVIDIGSGIIYTSKQIKGSVGRDMFDLFDDISFSILADLENLSLEKKEQK